MSYRSLVLLASTLMISLLFAACRSNDTANSSFVKQSEIHQEYYIEQEAGKPATARAQFRFGGNTGTTLVLDQKASITFNGGTMSPTTGLINIDGTFYLTEFANDSPSQHTFVWTDNDGKQYTNKLALNPIAMTSPVAMIDKSKGIKLQLQGPALVTGEEIVWELTDTSGKSIKMYCRPDQSSGTTFAINFTPDEIAGLYPGPCVMSLHRRLRKNVDEGTNLGGSMEAVYKTADQKVMLVGPQPPTGPAPAQ